MNTTEQDWKELQTLCNRLVSRLDQIIADEKRLNDQILMNLEMMSFRVQCYETDLKEVKEYLA